MKNGEKIVLKVLDSLKNNEFSTKDGNEIKNLILPFITKTEDLDLMTISKLEVLLNEKLLLIPTKQEWRKIKLKRLNEIINKKDE